jgi:hypothetical protein
MTQTSPADQLPFVLPHGMLWEPMRLALRRDDGALHRRLVELRAAAGLSQAISPLRVFDVIAWREGVAARGDSTLGQS